MIQPDEIVDLLNAKNAQLDHGLTLKHVVNTIENIYQQRHTENDEDEPSLIFIASKFDNTCGKTFEIGFYPSYSFFQPVEILLKYPRNWRNWFLNKREGDVLEFSTDNGIDFSEIYNAKWFRRHANVPPNEFVCRMKTDEELEQTAQAMALAFDSGL